ncbi:MAG TPA: hypothetical protein DF715_15825, partial [Oceanicaulis sp.]|nr:hypothetical protein [Oceanicaulis sp.]
MALSCAVAAGGSTRGTKVAPAQQAFSARSGTKKNGPVQEHRAVHQAVRVWNLRLAQVHRHFRTTVERL